MAAIVADASVIISVALQHGVKAEALAASISRVPIEIDGEPVKPASVLGAALDALVRYERGEIEGERDSKANDRR